MYYKIKFFNSNRDLVSICCSSLEVSFSIIRRLGVKFYELEQCPFDDNYVNLI